MGERPSPSPAAEVPQTDILMVSNSVIGDARWPPRGWPMFSCVTNQSGTAPCDERGGTHNAFLRYDVSITDDDTYALEIMSGEIGQQGTKLAPAMGIRFKDREDWFDENPQHAVKSIHICGQNMIPEKSAVLRVILAMTYIISRIDRSQAPNLKRVLKIYRLG